MIERQLGAVCVRLYKEWVKSLYVHKEGESTWIQRNTHTLFFLCVCECVRVSACVRDG